MNTKIHSDPFRDLLCVKMVIDRQNVSHQVYICTIPISCVPTRFFVKLLLCQFSHSYDSLFLYEKELSSPFSIKELGGLLSSFNSAESLFFYARDYPVKRTIPSRSSDIFIIGDEQSNQSMCIK